MKEKIGFGEKVGYGLGDLASNLFWMQFVWFLNYFYTDVFGLAPAVLATMMGITRIWDSINDPIVGILADRTESRWGKFRPYILFGAIPFGICGVMMFTTPNLSATGKLTYAYVTYCAMVLIYTVVNIPYSSLMGVISAEPKERTSFSQIRFIMAFTGGLIVQAATLPMIAHFGAGDTSVINAQIIQNNGVKMIEVQEVGNGASRLELTAKLPGYEEPTLGETLLKRFANIPVKKNEGKVYRTNKTIYINTKEYFIESKILFEKDGKLYLDDKYENEYKHQYDPKSDFNKIRYAITDFGKLDIDMSVVFKKKKDELSDEMIPVDISKADISLKVINEQNGFQLSMTVFAVAAVLMFFITFATTKERVKPPQQEKTPLLDDIKDLITNVPWLILFALGIITLFHVCLRNGTIMYYFKYVVKDTDPAPLFMLAGTIANLVSLLFVGIIEKYLGKKKGFAFLIGATAGFTFLFGILPIDNLPLLFTVHIIINLMFGPTAALVWAMYTDAADFSEWRTGRRATGLVMSACTMAQKFGYTLGGMLGMATLSWIGFKANTVQTQEAVDGIIGMVSWMSAIPCVIGFVLILFYPLSEEKLKQIEEDLNERRAKAKDASEETDDKTLIVTEENLEKDNKE